MTNESPPPPFGRGTRVFLIPPGVITIIYAVTAGVPIGKMFNGVVLPGVLLSELNILYIADRCWLQPELGARPVARRAEGIHFEKKNSPPFGA
jgi:TRAP-type mannitol/chloroaromatic compound transport system permease large subunit